MIFKLSLKNLKAHVPNYLVYYISMTFAAVVYYCFRAIAYNQPLVAGAGRDIEIKRSLGLGSTLVTIIILGFMLAANRFFIGKRSQEIGLYRLICLRKSQVSLIFLVENLVLGFVSLINGIILGVIFTKLFSMILAKVMFLEVPSFFYISWRSVIETGVAFAFMILIVCLRSIWMIYRYPLSQLMHQEKIGQINYSRLTKRRQFLGILGPICLLAGYFIAFDFRNLATGIVYKQLNDSLDISIPMIITLTPFIILGLCVVGTYLFFRYTMYFIIRLFNHRKKWYYQDLRMITLGNAKRYLFKSSKTLTGLTLLIATALSGIGVMVFVYTISMHTVNSDGPVDFLVSQESYPKLKKVLDEAKDTKIKNEVTLSYKITGIERSLRIGQAQEEQETIEAVNVLSFSNYRNYQKINPYLNDLHLKNDQSVIYMDSFTNILSGMSRYESKLQFVEGEKAQLQQVLPNYLGNFLLQYSLPTIVVSDALYQKVTKNSIQYQINAVNVDTKSREKLYEAVNKQIATEWQAPILYKYEKNNQQLSGFAKQMPNEEAKNTQDDVTETWRLNMNDRYASLRYERKINGLTLYVSMFVAILALFITGSILMLRQLFSAVSERQDYVTLKRMGVSSKAITKQIYRQNSLIFFPPMVIGILHTTFAIYLLSQFIKSPGYLLVYLSCGILIIVYLIFYILTSAIYARMIRHIHF
ncbi:FtsX-like permease family protein [Enterococcus faecalis]|uniref:FtsX-like permease family protein n=1 Tax=Enterococcus faecalis TaxID=1351 RepID=UPI0034E5A750